MRSRLEARWGVYWDGLQTVWQYEPQGFMLREAVRYLPDFWLPELSVYAEVKPEAFSATERTKCAELCRQTRMPVFQLTGLPDGIVYEAWHVRREAVCCLPLELTAFSAVRWTAEQIEAAAALARSARFEFGESGGKPPTPMVRLTGREFLEHFPQLERGTIANIFLLTVRRANPATTADEVLAGVWADVYQRRAQIRRWAARVEAYVSESREKVERLATALKEHEADARGYAKYVIWYESQPYDRKLRGAQAEMAYSKLLRREG